MQLSEISMKPSIYKALWTTQILSIVAFIVSALLGEGYFAVGLVIILGIYGVFYWLSPYMIRLEEPSYKKSEQPWYMSFVAKIKKNLKQSKKRQLEQQKIKKMKKYFKKKNNENDNSRYIKKGESDSENYDSNDIFSS